MELPPDVKTRLVQAIGAYIRAVPAQVLPSGLKRFHGFTKQGLAPHADKLLAALENDDLRAKLIDWLDEVKPQLPKDHEELLRIAALRDDGWEAHLSDASTARPPRPKPDGEERLATSLDREKEKTRKAREELKELRVEFKRAQADWGRTRSALENSLATSEANGSEAIARATVTEEQVGRIASDAEKEKKRLLSAEEKAKSDATTARAELKETRRRLAASERECERLATRVDALEKRIADLSHAETAPASGRRRRTPMPVPRGRLPEDPQTLDEWLSAAGVRLLIDGYNVTMASGGFGELHLESQRDRLVRTVSTFAEMKGVSTTIVFDGKDVGRHPGRNVRGLVRVQYSQGEIADDHLVAMVRSHPATPVVVVTSDRELTERVEALGANVASSPQLLALIR